MSLLLALGGSGPTYTLTADSASFTLAGQDAGLSFNRVLAAANSAYSLTGQATAFALNRVLSAASAAYSLAGQDVTLSYSVSAYDIKVYQALFDTSAVPYDIKVYQCGFNTSAAVAEQNSGGYEHLGRRQTPKQRKQERQRLGIISKDIREATQKVARAVIVETGIIHPVRHFEQHREQFERMLIQELKGYWSESLTDALYAQIEAAWTRKIDQENEEIILLLM